MKMNGTLWPELEWDQWKDTGDTLHMYLQIVGKTRLALMPIQNHWWSIPLYLTARGLTTSPLPLPSGDSLDIEFDFVAHDLVFRNSEGTLRRQPLRAQSVKDFFREYTHIQRDFGVDIHIDPMPVELSNPVRFDEDQRNCSYDSDAVGRFWQCLRHADFLFKRFSTGFYGKISPVHFFWGSMDLAVTRFNGRRAPMQSDRDPVQSEAYSHEVISAGFWPGNGGYGQAAFYTYAAPVPGGLATTPIIPPGRFEPSLGEYILNYSDVVRSDDPEGTVMSFLESSYVACATAARWNRSELDRSVAYVRHSRPNV